MKKKDTIFANKVLEISLWLYIIFALLLSPIYNTFLFALPIIIISITCYYLAKYLLPQSNLYQYIGSGCLAVFTALLIYQSHGIMEMHFLAFVASILLIQFKKWQVQLPLITIVVIHHITLAYAQFGANLDVFFMAENDFSWLTFILHLVLAAIIFFLCSYWAFIIEKYDTKLDKHTQKLQSQIEINDKIELIASKIANGDLSSKFEVDEKNTLSKALKIMQSNLVKAHIKENEEKFYNLGLAQAADILREHNDNLKTLSTKILVFLIKYVNANQGGVFLLNDLDTDNIYLEQTASYAYDRNKFLTKKIQLNEGLLGACFHEKEVIYMTDVPPTYIHITSGLGLATPKAIIIVPLIANETVNGVIEMAFFNEIELFKINFIKKVCEIFASTVQSVEASNKTKKLLEKSQLQTQTLRNQEEEMRQNMEELLATQEEMSRKNSEIENTIKTYQNLTKTIDSTFARLEIRPNGKIIEANQVFLDLLQLKNVQVNNKTFNFFIEPEIKNTTEYLQLWNQLNMGISSNFLIKSKNALGQSIWLKCIFKPLVNEEAAVEKILVLAMNITQEIEKIEYLENVISSSNIKVK